MEERFFCTETNVSEILVSELNTEEPKEQQEHRILAMLLLNC